MSWKVASQLCGVLILFSAVNSACSESTPDYDSPVYQELRELGQTIREQRYNRLKNRIKRKQQLFLEEYNRSDANHRNTLLALSKKYVYAVMTDTIFPFWYDTRWDYNGTTQTPGKGKIACGYFVTTTLEHMGFRLERSRLAQQASSRIIETVCGKGKTHIIGNRDFARLRRYMLSQQDGIYIIGLDNHVGFLHKSDTSVYAIHSNGVSGSLMVVREPISSCKLIRRSQAYYIGNLMKNDELFLNWIHKKPIKTIAS